MYVQFEWSFVTGLRWGEQQSIWWDFVSGKEWQLIKQQQPGVVLSTEISHMYGEEGDGDSQSVF